MDHGSIVLVNPQHEAAREWLEEHTDGMWWCGSLAVEFGCIGGLVHGMIAEGWHV